MIEIKEYNGGINGIPQYEDRKAMWDSLNIELYSAEYNSYIFQEPATLFLVALEDSKILQLSYEDEQTLKSANHKFERFFRLMAEHQTAFLQQRIITNLTQDARNRYLDFIENHADVMQRVPQYALASFLGMSTEYLSKLRNDRVSRK